MIRVRIRDEPTLVIEPKRWCVPVECSRGTPPQSSPLCVDWQSDGNHRSPDPVAPYFGPRSLWVELLCYFGPTPFCAEQFERPVTLNWLATLPARPESTRAKTPPVYCKPLAATKPLSSFRSLGSKPALALGLQSLCASPPTDHVAGSGLSTVLAQASVPAPPAASQNRPVRNCTVGWSACGRPACCACVFLAPNIPVRRPEPYSLAPANA